MADGQQQAITPEEVMEAVNAIRKSMENYGPDSPEFKAVQEKAEKALTQFDEYSNQQALASQEAKKKEEEFKERIDTLELEVAKGAPVAGINYKQQPEYKALQKYIQFGGGALQPDDLKLLVPVGELKTLRTDVDTGAGYLTFPEFDTEIIKGITEISPMRSVAKVKSIGAKTITGPTRTGIPSAAYEGEAEEGGGDQSAYGSETLTAHRITVTVPFTRDQLADSRFDLMAEINSDVMEAIAQKEGNKFVLGTGVKQPEGFVANAAVVAAARTSAGSGVLVANDLILLTGDLKVGYNPVFVFNRQTLATLRTLKDGAGAYIWHAGSAGVVGTGFGQAGSVPNTIAGEPYVVMQDMASIAANSLSVAYGDFARGYRIVDWIGMEMIRDDVTSKKKAIIEVTFHRYNHGQVVLAEAIKLLKTKA